MGFEGWDLVYVRYEPKAIDRFKNKSKILSDFGASGLRVYNALDGVRKSSDIRASLNIDSVQFSKIMDFMITNQFIFEKQSSKNIDFSNSSQGNTLNSSSNIQSYQSSTSSPLTNSVDDSFESSNPPTLSPSEQKIFNAYGDMGLKVFSLIDGQKSARQILEQTGVSQNQLIQMLEFMNKNGIIKLDTPTQNQQPQTTPNQNNRNFINPNMTNQQGARAYPHPYSNANTRQSSNSASSEAGFSPMVEHAPSPPNPVLNHENDSKEMFLSIPSLGAKPSIFSKIMAIAILALKFGKIGTSLLPRIDGTKDIIQISIESELSFHDLDIIFHELANNKLLTFKPLERNQIQTRYGDDGLAVFKKFGRDGVLVYQLIGKSNTLKDIVLKSKLPKERAVDIILFVHSMLGLDVALDRDMIYRYISKKD